ncbi:hypothetical protein HYC85_029582 [Camellia sinensis]|uniref:Uncharacterized protein n=1 Tax=Camellia sinensis TaxID=4442 RepID=A0A7J7FZP3_CAMSI|nr:hypothetical protein HYC85_029582 [Camellia sinensis]
MGCSANGARSRVFWSLDEGDMEDLYAMLQLVFLSRLQMERRVCFIEDQGPRLLREASRKGQSFSKKLKKKGQASWRS